MLTCIFQFGVCWQQWTMIAKCTQWEDIIQWNQLCIVLPKTPCIVMFSCVNPTVVMKYINDLASKSSCGSDKISSILLKRLANYIVTPLTVMINQSLCTGIFPDKLKLAKVIPIYKRVTFLIINAPYLSSQLSQRFSKKLCSFKIMTTLVLINFCFKTSMASENAIQRNLLR